jgi:predicted branched-subunit amino acid permease
MKVLKAFCDWGLLTVQHPGFRLGVRDMIAPSLGIAAWALVTGVAMVDSGLSLPLAIAMSLLVYAGSAQLAVLPLMVVGAPLWVLWVTACCVNMRFVVFSAVWRPYFSHLRLVERLGIGYFSGDAIFAVFMRRFALQPASTQAATSTDTQPTLTSEQRPYFWGAAATNWLNWQFFSILGMVLAHRVPLAWGVGFAGVLALLALLLALLKDRASWVATGVACTAAVAAFALPLRMHILVAIAAAVAAGLLMEAAQRQLPTSGKAA